MMINKYLTQFLCLTCLTFFLVACGFKTPLSLPHKPTKVVVS